MTELEPSGYHLAQVNTPRLRFPLGAPEMTGFIALIEEVNGAADASTGFVWRQEHPSLTEAHTIFGDPNLIVNLSLWTDTQSLLEYFRSAVHAQAFRRRLEWFEKPDGQDRASLALWWVPKGHVPTIPEAEERIMYLTEHGPSPYAFDFHSARRFPNPALLE